MIPVRTPTVTTDALLNFKDDDGDHRPEHAHE
jgi:hypothetical protein